MSLSFTLSVGGVEFRLDPAYTPSQKSDPEVSSPFLSVNKEYSSVGSGNSPSLKCVTVALRGFEGTLRISPETRLDPDSVCKNISSEESCFSNVKIDGNMEEKTQDESTGLFLMTHRVLSGSDGREDSTDEVSSKHAKSGGMEEYKTDNASSYNEAPNQENATASEKTFDVEDPSISDGLSLNHVKELKSDRMRSNLESVIDKSLDDENVTESVVNVIPIVGEEIDYIQTNDDVDTKVPRFLSKNEADNSIEDADTNKEMMNILTQTADTVHHPLIPVKVAPDNFKGFQRRRLSSNYSTRIDIINAIDLLPGNKYLHYLCDRTNIGIEELLHNLRANPSHAMTHNSKGETPLHVFSRNEHIMNRLKIEDIQSFVKEILEIFPGAMLAKNKEDEAPFMASLSHWVKELDNPCSNLKHRGSTCSLGIKISNFEALTDPESNSSSEMSEVKITPIVRVVLQVLSFVLGTKNAVDSKNPELITQNVSKIPFILQAILMIEDDGDRVVVFDMIIFHRLIFQRVLVGEWIVSMLKKGGRSTSGVINYLEMISGQTAFKFYGSHKLPNRTDVLRYDNFRNEVCSAVSEMSGIVTAMIAVEQKERERAACSHVVVKLLDKAMADYFIIGKLLLDFTFLVMLLIFFKIDYTIMAHGMTDSTSGIVLISGLYNILSSFETLCYITTDSRVMLQLFTNFWDMVHLLSLLIPVFVIVFEKSSENTVVHYPFLGAFAVGLLWLRILGFLKTINMQLATYILVLSEIFQMVQWFLLVVGIFILMFTDMISFSSLTSEAQCNKHAMNCTSLFGGYIDVYLQLLSPDPSNFSQESSTMGLYLIFSVLVIIVLLNIFIAIICDEYQHARTHSKSLLADARIRFLSSQMPLKKVFCPLDSDVPILPIELLKGVSTFLFFSLFGHVNHLLSVSYRTWIPDNGNNNQLDEITTDMFLFLIGLSGLLFNIVMLALSKWVLKWSISENIFIRKFLRGSAIDRYSDYLWEIPVRFVYMYLIEMDKDDDTSMNNEEISKQYIEIQTRRIVHESEARISAELKRMLNEIVNPHADNSED